MNNLVLLCLALVLTVAFGLMLYLTTNIFAPYFWIFLYAFLITLIISRLAGKFKRFVFNFSFVFLAFSIFELYFAFKEQSQKEIWEGDYAKNYFVEDSIRGYGVERKREKYAAIKKNPDGKVLYKVEYNIDDTGLRKTPWKNSEPIFFFGDSFTFGEGVQDSESLPYIFSEISGYKTYNFGFHGYGPHQMLRMLEVDLPTQLVRRNPKFVIYTAITPHIDRAAGYASWDQIGPYYKLLNGVPTYAGKINENKYLPTFIFKIMDRSEIYIHVILPFIEKENRTRDRERFVAIIERSKQLVNQRYDSQFIVLLWDCRRVSTLDEGDSNYIKDKLVESGVRFFSLSERIPGICDSKYYIPSEGHPNGIAYKSVAEFLSSELPQR